MTTEPARITGAVTSLLLAIFNAAAVFGFTVADSTQQTIIVIVTAVINLAFTMGAFEFVRNHVWAPETVARDFTPKPGVKPPGV